MRFNHFDSLILGAINHGQVNAVEGTHRPALRALFARIARCLSLCLGSWCALKRMPAGMTPATATCPSYSGRSRQRQERWMSGVVVDPGTVGVG